MEYFEVAEMAAKAGMIVIGDLKRADIGSTSEAYAKAYLDADSPFSIITVNPYFGTDGVMPFIELANQNEKGVFVLVKTSNQSSIEIQDLILRDQRKVHEAVADMVKHWGNISNPTEDGYNNVGAVVGATHPDDARRLRQRMPNTFFLVPGYGAQGATAEDVVVNFDENVVQAMSMYDCELALESIVQSIDSVCNVSKVQFSVNGDTLVEFADGTTIDHIYEAG